MAQRTTTTLQERGLSSQLKHDTFTLQARHLHRLLNSVQCLIDTSETPFRLRLMLMIQDVIKGRTSATVSLYTSPSPRDRQKTRMPSSA